MSDETKMNFVNGVIDRGIFYKWNGDSSELITKCPFCGDNNKSDDGHLYISINYGKNEPMLYHCFKCNVGGIITADIAEYFVNDEEIVSSISKMNGGKRYNIKISSHGKNYIWKMPEPDIEYKYKIQYVNNRLGLKIDKDFYDRSKMILDFKKFLQINCINTTIKKYFLDMLQKKFVGFLSSKGTHVWFRNIIDEEIRWFKYPLVKSTTSKNFYSVSNTVDILSPAPINLNLSEGIFDCLSIWKNLHHDAKNDINIAVGSTDYSGIIEYLISLGFIGSNVNLNIYSDNDKNSTTSLQYHKKVLNKYKVIFGEINIYYNIIGKDCGVPVNEIKLKKEIIT